MGSSSAKLGPCIYMRRGWRLNMGWEKSLYRLWTGTHLTKVMQQLQILSRDAWEQEAVKYMWKPKGRSLLEPILRHWSNFMGESWGQLKTSPIGHVMCAKFKFNESKVEHIFSCQWNNVSYRFWNNIRALLSHIWFLWGGWFRASIVNDVANSCWASSLLKTYKSKLLQLLTSSRSLINRQNTNKHTSCDKCAWSTSINSPLLGEPC